MTERFPFERKWGKGYVVRTLMGPPPGVPVNRKALAERAAQRRAERKAPS